MLRGIYTSNIGMLAQETRLDAIVNNVANMGLLGFKRDAVAFRSFPEVLLQRLEKSQGKPVATPVGTTNWGTLVEISPDITSGPVVQTGNSTDLALTEDDLAFFTLDTPEGTLYTRNGAFRVDMDGYLVNSQGNPVMGTEGWLRVEKDDFNVTTDGRVTSGGEEVGTLLISSFAGAGDLQRVSTNLYSATPAAAPVPSTAAWVRQGSLEEANVDLSVEMVNMTQASIAYSVNQRMLRVHDELLGRAANELGNLRA